MAFGAPTSEKPVVHKQFRITVVPTDNGFEAWTERLDGGLVCCGYSMSQASGTHEYLAAEHALAAAIRAIDTGEVRDRP
jgi:hypothetical protein